MRAARRDLDVLVVGGGTVGHALALLLATQARTRSLAVGLVEPRPPAVALPGAPEDLRIFALSRASQHVLTACGVWQQVASRSWPYQRMRVWDATDEPSGGRALAFSAAEAGEPDLGHMVEVAHLQHVLHAAVRRAGIRIETSPVDSLSVDEDHARVTLADGTLLHSALVVAADGAASPVRSLAGIEAAVHDYHQRGVVAFLRTERPHAETAWQRFLPSGPLALLPVDAGRVSIVWTLPTDEALRVLALDDAAFGAAVTLASDGVLGSLTLDSHRDSFPLRRITAASYGACRTVLVGDAAHAVHPLAGQGANLGLLDAAALVEVLAAAGRRGEDPGDAGPVGRYARWRRAEAAPLTLGVHALQRGFCNDVPWLRELRSRGLGWVGASPGWRRQFVRHALGMAGEAPRLSLGRPLE